jgi:hypothetical protein
MKHTEHSKDNTTKICPKTGKPIHRRFNKRWLKWLFPITSLLALIWFLIRVVPKPSRALYPCQRIAQPLASGFVVWLTGLIASAAAYRKAKRLFHQSRYIVGAAAVAVAVAAIFWPLCLTADKTSKAAPFVPADLPNTPIGVAKGIHPGRVVWVYDPALTDQNGTAGHWWDDSRTDPTVAHSMMSRAIRNLTSIADEAEAWDAIFKYFNFTHTGIEASYEPGEKIAIKVNNIFSRSYRWTSGQSTNAPCPQMLYALLWQLVEFAGVPDSDITVYDCIFYQGDPVYNYCHTDFPGVRFAEGDATDRSGYGGGPGPNPGQREKVVPDPNVHVYYGDPDLVPDSGMVCFPTVVTEAKYLINIALPRPHELAGVTLCAKNLFGSVWHPNYWDYYHGWNPAIMHAAVAAYDFSGGITARPMGSYNALVDLMGHEQLGGKTLLFFVECLRNRFWSARPFNGGLSSSLFVSQDGVAIDSVLVDFLRSEGDVSAGSVDNYLHEAALADNPPSGTIYDPENDGIPLGSLGVHEHWNNSTDKQYSRNLGTDEGIELVQSIVVDVTPGDFEPDGDVDEDDFSVLAAHWLESDMPGCVGDLDGDCDVDLDDLDVWIQSWNAGASTSSASE